MNYVRELVDKHKISKYRIRKELGVSWRTVKIWYDETFNPNPENLKKIKLFYSKTTNGNK